MILLRPAVITRIPNPASLLALQVTHPFAVMIPIHLGLGPRNLILHSNKGARKLRNMLIVSALLCNVGQTRTDMIFD